MNDGIGKRLEAARDLISSDPASVRLSALARHACVSPYHFHRLYRGAFGETPLQTATRKRLDECVRRLRDTDDSILEICIDVGYSSSTTFSAWFATACGTSPSSYRQFCRNQQDSRIILLNRQAMMTSAMKAKITIVSYFVSNQDAAASFYTQKLGFEVIADVNTPDGFRWLTVAPPESDVQIALLPVAPAMGMTPEAEAAVKVLQKSGLLGSCVFAVDDCMAVHQELTSKGVKVMQEPHEEFYGIQAIYLDPDGNSLTFVQEPSLEP